MKPLTVVVPYTPDPFFEKTLILLAESDPGRTGRGRKSRSQFDFKMERCRVLVAGPLPSHETLSLILAEIRTKYLLLFHGANKFRSSLKPWRNFWGRLSPQKQASSIRISMTKANKERPFIH